MSPVVYEDGSPSDRDLNNAIFAMLILGGYVCFPFMLLCIFISRNSFSRSLLFLHFCFTWVIHSAGFSILSVVSPFINSDSNDMNGSGFILETLLGQSPRLSRVSSKLYLCTSHPLCRWTQSPFPLYSRESQPIVLPMRLGLPCASPPPVVILRPLIAAQLWSTLAGVLNYKTETSGLTMMTV